MLDKLRISWSSLVRDVGLGYCALVSASTRGFYDMVEYDAVFTGQDFYAENIVKRIQKHFSSDNYFSLGHVLDAGCGSGVYSRRLSEISDTLHTLDISQGQLERFRRKDIPGSAVLADATALPYPPDHFDMVTSLCMIRHLPGAKMRSHFDEAYRTLKKGGLLIPIEIDAFENRNPFVDSRCVRFLYDAFMRLNGIDEHVVTQPEIRTALQESGFTVSRFHVDECDTDILYGIKA